MIVNYGFQIQFTNGVPSFEQTGTFWVVKDTSIRRVQMSGSAQDGPTGIYTDATFTAGIFPNNAGNVPEFKTPFQYDPSFNPAVFFLPYWTCGNGQASNFEYERGQLELHVGGDFILNCGFVAGINTATGRLGIVLTLEW